MPKGDPYCDLGLFDGSSKIRSSNINSSIKGRELLRPLSKVVCVQADRSFNSQRIGSTEDMFGCKADAEGTPLAEKDVEHNWHPS